MSAQAPPTFAASRMAPSLAGSIVYIHRYDVWVSRPDGTGAHAVTRDGTAKQPYLYPSEDAHGRIAASHGPTTLVLLDQGGALLRQWHATNDFPSISPDGRTIAFSYLTRTGSVSTQFDHVLRYIDTSATKSSGKDLPHSFQSDSIFASWATDDRSVITRFSKPTQVNYHDLTSPSEHLWFSDCDSVDRPCATAPDVDNDNWMATVDRSGTRFASVITLGGPTAASTIPTFLAFQSTSGAHESTPPQEPALACAVPGSDSIAYPRMDQVSIQTPSWSPDGRSLVAGFRSAGGAWQVWRIDVGADITACDQYGGGPILDGAEQPRWSAAPLLVATHVQLRSSKRTVARRQAVHLTATVGGPRGTVRFVDGGDTLGTVRVVRRRAELTIHPRRIGTHRIRAVYSGDSTHLASQSGAVVVTVHH